MARTGHLISAILACAFSLVVQPPPASRIVAQDGGNHAQVDPRFSDRGAQTAESLNRSIREELTTLNEHAWAGEYEGGGYLDTVSLVLAPKTGFVFEWHGCFGLHDRNCGTIDLDDERIRLSFRWSNKRDGLHGIAEEFIPVPWDDRMYLVPSDDVIGFCNIVNAGSEPGGYTDYLRRTGGETKDPIGLPEMPVEFRSYLLADPVEAEIIGIGESTMRPSIVEFSFVDTTVTLNAGKNDGLLPGMELYVINPDVLESVTLKKVEEERSEAVMIQIDELAERPRIGWRLSTRLSGTVE